MPPPPPLPGTGLPDENKGPAILISCGTLTIIAIIAVAVRMFVRIKMIKAVALDDYAILIALTLSVTGMGAIIPEVMNGAGRHAVYLPPTTNLTGLKLNYITQPIYLWTACFVKVSVALFLLRIASTKLYRRFLWGSIAFLILYNLMCFFTIVFQCRPIRGAWEGPSANASCFSILTLQALSYTAQFAIFTDLVFTVLPILMLRNVQIKPRVKFAIIGIMSLGIFASIASMIKFHYLSLYGKTGDFLWDSRNLTIWGVTETNIGILAASIPCMKPLFKRLLELTTSYINSKPDSQPSHTLFNLKPNISPPNGKGKNQTSAVRNYRQSRLSDHFIDHDTVSQEEILSSKIGIIRTAQAEVSRSSSSERGNIVAIEDRQKPLSFSDQV